MAAGTRRGVGQEPGWSGGRPRPRSLAGDTSVLEESEALLGEGPSDEAQCAPGPQDGAAERDVPERSAAEGPTSSGER